MFDIVEKEPKRSRESLV